MAQVIVPQRQSGTQQLLGALPAIGTVAGGVAGGVGGAAGGPGGVALGAAEGAGKGAAIGGMVGNLGNAISPQSETQGLDNSSAVSRRMQGMQQMPSIPDQQATLNNARIALQSQPLEVQKEYAPMLMAASAQLRRQQGVG